MNHYKIYFDTFNYNKYNAKVISKDKNTYWHSPIEFQTNSQLSWIQMLKNHFNSGEYDTKITDPVLHPILP